jgi:hypothetical protein
MTTSAKRQHYPPISREPIVTFRVRRIEGGFAFIEHRFLHHGFFAQLTPDELLLYLLLVLAGDRQGVSFYGEEAIGALCRLSPVAYQVARQGLLDHDLIATDGRRFQVLSLPERPTVAAPLRTVEDFEARDPSTIRTLIRQSLGLAETPEAEGTRHG